MLEICDIYKIYSKGTAQETAVLRGASFSFQDGVFYAIIGKSGCGKTTLLHILGGLDVPDQGKVLLDGVDLFGLSRRERAILRRRRMGFIFQSYNLLQEHTVWENIAMPYILDGKRVDQKRLNEVCSTLEIEKLLHKYPVQLSGGEQQRIAIARAMIHNPSIIFADEPTGNLDPQTAGTTVALLKKVVKQFGTTLVLVTHDMEIAAESQETIRIEEGQIVGN
jgi:lipoprotein ABC transporter, ATP-binding protein lolD